MEIILLIIFSLFIVLFYPHAILKSFTIPSIVTLPMVKYLFKDGSCLDLIQEQYFLLGLSATR